MIITIKKAVLHICGAASGTTVYSDKELDITDASINSYIINHLKKALNNESLRKGRFTDGSKLKSIISDYISQNTSFIEMSAEIALRYECYSECKTLEDFDILITEIIAEGKKYLCMLNLKVRNGYNHKVIHDDLGYFNSFQDNHAILPFANQSITECALIDMETFDILYISKMHVIDGERVDVLVDGVLDCVCKLKSSKETIKAIESILKINTSSSEAAVEKAVKLKKSMINKINSGSDTGTYTVDDICDGVFSSSEKENFIEHLMRKDIITDKDDELPLDEYTKKKSCEKIRIETDNGIEIKFPADLFNNPKGITADRYSIGITGFSEYKLK